MKTVRIASLTLSALLSTHLLATSAIQRNNDLNDESLDVAELIINLSQSLANDLDPPSTGAERTVTNATVTDSGNTRTYYIEGEDVYHNGRVLSTYWVRLVRKNSSNGSMTTYSYDAGHDIVPMEGRELSPEAQELIKSMLNSVYDLAELELEHQHVSLDRITKVNDEPLMFDIVGVNQICEHIELNTFKISVTRHIERNRALYETELTHPYTAPEDVIPDHPESRCSKWWPC